MNNGNNKKKQKTQQWRNQIHNKKTNKKTLKYHKFKPKKKGFSEAPACFSS